MLRTLTTRREWCNSIASRQRQALRHRGVSGGLFELCNADPGGLEVSAQDANRRVVPLHDVFGGYREAHEKAKRKGGGRDYSGRAAGGMIDDMRQNKLEAGGGGVTSKFTHRQGGGRFQQRWPDPVPAIQPSAPPAWPAAPGPALQTQHTDGKDG